MTSPQPPRSFLTIQDTKQYYLDNITRYGVDAPRTMGYHASPIDDRLIANLLPPKIEKSYSVLDVGCGLGQLIPILENKFPNSKIESYIGLDLVEEFVDLSSKQFPNYKFYSANFLEWDSVEQFDLVIAAGVLVTRISDFESYLEKFIAKIVASSKCWIGFNVVTTCGPSYTAKHLATISDNQLNLILSKFTGVQWTLDKKEVFPGSEDTFVRGTKLID